MIKIALRNFLKAPTTDPYPFGETFVPKELRGKPIVNDKACTACKTCEYVCPSGAIKIEKKENKYIHTIWYNSCCYCGNCEFFCPTGAIFLTDDFHTANIQKEKYSFISSVEINEIKCELCGINFVPATKELLDRAYPKVNEKILKLTKICPQCRKKQSFLKNYQIKE